MKKLFITLFALSAVTSFAQQAHGDLDDATVDVQVRAVVGSRSQLIIADTNGAKVDKIEIDHGTIYDDKGTYNLSITSANHKVMRTDGSEPLFSLTGQNSVDFSLSNNGVLVLTGPDAAGIETKLSVDKSTSDLDNDSKEVPFSIISDITDTDFANKASGYYQGTATLTVTVDEVGVSGAAR